MVLISALTAYFGGHADEAAKGNAEEIFTRAASDARASEGQNLCSFRFFAKNCSFILRAD
jgi:hypothetical protein